MITLFATSPDGWALARDEDSRWLVRPPYRQANRYRLNETQTARILMDGDFQLSCDEFPGWGALCRHLEQHRVSSATPSELETAKDAAKKLLRRATAQQAARHLGKIESELEAGRVGGSEEALLALLQAPAVQGVPELIQTIGRLLEQAKARPGVVIEIGSHPNWPVRDEAGVTSRAAIFAERGSILGLVA